MSYIVDTASNAANVQALLDMYRDWDIIDNVWRVVYFHKALMRCYREELIDALFDMILKLKEEGVI